MDRLGEDRGFVAQDVGSPVDETLIVHQPGGPGLVEVERPATQSPKGVDHRAWQEGHRFRGIAGVAVAAARPGRLVEREGSSRSEIERLEPDTADPLTGRGPGGEPFPAFLAGFVHRGPRQVGRRTAPEMLVQERQQEITLIFEGGVGTPLHRA